VTSATAQARPEPETGFSKARRAFRNWRRTRPFWGGLLVLLAGLPILYFPYANLSIGTLSIHLATSAGAASLLIGLLLIALGVSVWFQPMIRVFAGIAALVLALVSIPMSNLGGFGLGLLPGLLGGAMIVSWAPLKQPRTADLVENGPQDALYAELPEPAGEHLALEAADQPEQDHTAVLPHQTGTMTGAEAPTQVQPQAQVQPQPLPGAQPVEGAHQGEQPHGQ
jgi:hypothetical protein